MVPEVTGFLTIMGFNPENKRIGANITRIKPNAKQNPLRNFSDQG
jgi:hypothetical protein